jgi:cold shock CspA family protein
MRLQGKVKTWNDEKGYGFIEQTGGGERAFLHISAFSTRRKRPGEGDLVTYEIEGSSKGPRAVNVAHVEDRAVSRVRSSFNFMGLLVGFVIVCAVAYILSIRMTHPNSTIQASVYKAVVDRSALNAHTRFTCEGKTQCSQMTSCAEAFFYQERCGANAMDGDHDGIPCEQQWCR